MLAETSNWKELTSSISMPPVVQWTTICLMFVLEILYGIKSMQGDITCDFLHVDLEENKTVVLDQLVYLK